MQRDFGEIYDFDTMSDREVRDVVVQHLREYPEVDEGWIQVEVHDGEVTLSGSVGTDGELQIAEHIVSDVLGINRYSNQLTVNELHRGQRPEAADEAIVQDNEVRDQLGEPLDQQTDTAEHLVADLEDETFGTHDMQQAIRDGTSYSPPDRPVPDGYRSRENH